MPAKVRDDKSRARVLAQHVVPLLHQRFERRILLRRIASAGKECEFEPALVVHVQRLPELLRVCRVDEDGQLESCRGLPDRRQCRVIDLQSRPIGLARGQPQSFTDLADADGASGDIRLELCHGFLGPAQSHVTKIHTSQQAHTITHRGRCPDLRHLPYQCLTGDVVGRDHHPHVQCIELRTQLRQSGL